MTRIDPQHRTHKHPTTPPCLTHCTYTFSQCPYEKDSSLRHLTSSPRPHQIEPHQLTSIPPSPYTPPDQTDNTPSIRQDEYAYILERCNIRVIAEKTGSHRQMSSFMLREGSFLLKQPDIIIPDLDGPRSFTLIDVNTRLRPGSPFLCGLVCQIRSAPPPGS